MSRAVVFFDFIRCVFEEKAKTVCVRVFVIEIN